MRGLKECCGCQWGFVPFRSVFIFAAAFLIYVEKAKVMQLGAHTSPVEVVSHFLVISFVNVDCLLWLQRLYVCECVCVVCVCFKSLHLHVYWTKTPPEKKFSFEVTALLNAKYCSSMT